MNFEVIELTNQVDVAHWSWTIAFFLWFVGLGGMGLFVNMWARSKSIFYICTACGLVGTLLVISHLSRITNLPAAAFNALMDGTLNYGSWMLIGIVLLSLYCLWTVIQSIFLLGLLKAPRFITFLGSEVAFQINGILGLFATAYSGFLLTQAHGVSLWSTAMIPTLWVISGLSSALGLVELLTGFGKLPYERVPWITKTSNVADSLEGLAIFALLLVAFSGDAASVAGAQRMLIGEGAWMFWGGAIFLGILLPLFINLKFGATNHSLNIIGGASAIIGALFLRASILMGGYFVPILMS